MKFFTLLATAAVATAASIPCPSIPGYPRGNDYCLSDAQANFIVKNFAGILSNTDRQKANASAQLAIADIFTETSDSINTLAGFPLGSVTSPTKQAYINGLVNAPPIPPFTTLDVFHDCTKISWRWNIPNLGAKPVKGINDFEINPKTGQVKSLNLEFNSIAWGTDIGWTCTPPPSS